MVKVIKAGIVGAIILFAWTAVSWMVLSWHESTIQHFSDETAVAQIIQANAPISGIYFIPFMKKGETPTEAQMKQPMLFASVHVEGMSPSMNKEMAITLLSQLVAAFLVAWMLLQTNLSYAGRVGFVVIFALAAGVITDIPMWTWFKFDTNYILMDFVDLIVGWFLAGLVMAKICKR